MCASVCVWEFVCGVNSIIKLKIQAYRNAVGNKSSDG